MAPVRDQISAPAPFRAPIEVFILIACACRAIIAPIDGGQAFLQAEEMHISDQLLAGPPESISLPWK